MLYKIFTKYIYIYIYDTNDLVTSVDGCSTRCPNMRKCKSLHHIDKNPKHIIKSYQTGYIFTLLLKSRTPDDNTKTPVVENTNSKYATDEPKPNQIGKLRKTKLKKPGSPADSVSSVTSSIKNAPEKKNNNLEYHKTR